MNKLIALLLVFALAFSLCACGSSGKTESTSAPAIADACQLLNSGQIKCFRVGNVYRIPKICVYDFLKKQTKTPHVKK